MDLEPTPYAEFPTPHRFQRPDYKYFKTIDDQDAFLKEMENSPDKLPPTPPIIIKMPRHIVAQRPKSAFSTSNLENLRQLLPSSALPPKSKIPDDWRPVFPEPDLSYVEFEDDRVNLELNSAASGSIDVPLNSAPDKEYSQDPQSQEGSRPQAPVPPKTSGRSSAVRPKTAHAALSLSVAEAVDFADVDESTKRPKSSKPRVNVNTHVCATTSNIDRDLAKTIAKLNSGQQDIQITCPQTTQRVPKRPQTAPARVLGDWNAKGSPLTIRGQKMGVHERTISPPVNVPALSTAYDQALAKYGWKMEIPGDPYGLKKEFLPPRKSTVLKVPEPQVRRLPPKMHRENRYTFFHTTVPRVMLSFDIHPNFTSEQYNKAREKKRQQGKWDYSYRDFAFIY